MLMHLTILALLLHTRTEALTHTHTHQHANMCKHTWETVKEGEEESVEDGDKLHSSSAC